MKDKRNEIKKKIIKALENAWKSGLIGLNSYEICKITKFSRPTISKYLVELKYEGVVKERNCGKNVKLYVLKKFYRF